MLNNQMVYLANLPPLYLRCWEPPCFSGHVPKKSQLFRSIRGFLDHLWTLFPWITHTHGFYTKKCEIPFLLGDFIVFQRSESWSVSRQFYHPPTYIIYINIPFEVAMETWLSWYLPTLRAHTPFRPHPAWHGTINKGSREYKSPTPWNFTFNWEDQQRCERGSLILARLAARASTPLMPLGLAVQCR